MSDAPTAPTNKTVTVTISISTNPQVDGRYFVDVRDTTRGRNRQMTTRTTHTPAKFLAELAPHAARNGVTVTVVDEVGALAAAS